MTQSPSSFNSIPEGTNRTLLLAASFLFPIVGIILGVMYMTKPDDASQKFGRHALMAATAAFVAFCVCFFCYFVVIMTLGFAPALMLPFLEPTSGILFFALS